MNTWEKEFVSEEHRNFRFGLGTTIASALSGYIAGAITATIGWLLYIYIIIE